MKVLMTCIRFPPAPGGAETHVLEISKRLAAKGHGIEVLTSDLYREIPFDRMMPGQEGYSSYQGLAVRRYCGYSLRGEVHYVLMPGMVWPFLAYGCDIVHAHSYGYFQVNLAALKRSLSAKASFVLTSHYHPEWSMWGGGRRKSLRRVYDRAVAPWVLARTDAIIGVSKHEMELMARLGFDESKISLIPNGIDFSLYEKIPSPWPFLEAQGLAKKKAAGWDIVLFAGRLASNKGIIQLVSAAKIILKSHPRTMFVIVGEDAGMKDKIELKVAELDITKNVLLTGHIKDDAMYRSAISACDMFVLPSEFEAFGIVLCEAMACEKPCVGSRVGGVPEVITDKKTGFIVEYDDVPALAEAISRVLAMPDKGRRMGMAGRKKVREKFTWDKVTDQIDVLYRRLRE